MSEIKLKVGDRVMLKDGTGPYKVEVNPYVYMINGEIYTDVGRFDVDRPICDYDVVEILPPEPTPPAWEIGKPYQTRDGRTAYVLKTDVKGSWPIVGYIEHCNGVDAYKWTGGGRAYLDRDTSTDLILPTPQQPVTIKRWVNIYSDIELQWHTSPKSAIESAASGIIASAVPVGITYTPGQGLSSTPE